MKTIIRNTAVPALAILFQVSLGTNALADRVIWERGQPQRGVSAPYDQASRIAPNPRDFKGRFQFDLEILQTLHHFRAEPITIRLAVNSRDGSMALYDPIEFIRQWDDSILEAFRPDIIFLHTDGTGFVSGEHSEYGHVTFAVQEMFQFDQDVWIASPASSAVFLDSMKQLPVESGARALIGGRYNRTNISKFEGYLANNRVLRIWRDETLSPVATQVGWLGLGVGLMKDPRARVNRVVMEAQYVGNDDSPGASFHLQHIHKKHQQFDTEGYNLVTGTLFSAFDELMDVSDKLRLLSNHIERERRNRALTHPEDHEGRRIIDQRIQDIENIGKRDMQEFIERHGLQHLGFSVE